MSTFPSRIQVVAMSAALAFSVSTSAARAQDATPTENPSAGDMSAPNGYPSHIHEGSCGDLDPAPLHPLASLAFERREMGAGAEQEAGTAGATATVAIPVAVSTTVLDVAIADIASGNRAINVHDADDASRSVACGDIVGQADEDGNLFIGLRELDDSGFTGVAWLLGTGRQTTVTVFLTDGATTGEPGSPDAPATPAP